MNCAYSMRLAQARTTLSPREVGARLAQLLEPKFRLTCYYIDFDRDTERVISKAAQKQSCSLSVSRGGQICGVNFVFENRREMLAAAKRIKKQIKGVRISALELREL